MRYRGLTLVFLALLLAACAGGLTDEGGVSGTWTGQLEGQLPLTLTLTQTGTTVTGNLRVDDGTAIPLTGTAVSNPENNGIILSLSGGGAENSVQIEASAEGSAMRGTLVTTGEAAARTGFTATR